MHDIELINRVRIAMQRAYVPYSGYPVGALVVTAQDHCYAGCNVENASYPLGHCAETAAIAAMVLAGEQCIKSIWIMSRDVNGATPCGGCRQRIREFSSVDTQVVLCSPVAVQRRMNFHDLLPHSFGPEYL